MSDKTSTNQYNKKQKICCFGEVLFRFSPILEGKFIKDACMPLYIGGAELNVASALSNYGEQASYLTGLPDNYLSNEIINEIKHRGIDTSAIKFCDGRIGVYYLPQGSDLKSNGVIYDRHLSSFSLLKPGDIDWDAVFYDVNWFHFSAISPALNEQTAALCLEGLQEASKRKITISVDLNYRKQLWQYGKKPADIMIPLVKFCHVIMGNIWSANSLLEIPLPTKLKPSYAGDKDDYLNESYRSAAAIMQQFTNCHTVANTFRFDVGAGINYFATIQNKDAQASSSTYTTAKVIDRVGSGDCFMAGLIYGLRAQLSLQHTVAFAAAAAFSKLHQTGDISSSTITDIEQTIRNNE